MHSEPSNNKTNASSKLMLDYVYEHEMAQANRVLLSQPMGAGQVKDYSWCQTMDQARRMATHLKSLAFEPGARIAILSKNCAHFFIAELAIWLAGGTTVAIFPTETAETIRYVLQHSGASLLFVGKLDLWEQQASAIPAGLPCIAMPLAPATPFESWDAITRRTAPLTGKVVRAPRDVAILMYTSGSTGQPKGVLHSFAGVTAASVGMQQYILQAIGTEAEIRVLSYLPLAHIYERAWIECVALVSGRTQVFFAESLDTFVQDLNRARPTVFASVPRLWLKFQQGVFHKVPAKKLERLVGIPLLGRLVGRKVLKGLGLDQVLLAASGSAPIPPALIAWYRTLGLNLMEGYAMTEDFAYSHASTTHFNAPGCVGLPMPGVEVRISEDGEVQLKSPGQMLGYYRQPELDAQVFTDDGFFRTGDKGERDAFGLLKLTGRVKELFKTGKGKYIAPAPIENLLNAHPMIELSLVSGVGQVAAYGLVVLAEDYREHVADANVRGKVEHELGKLLHSANSQLSDYERLRMLVVAPEPWSIKNGFLTPTMKIKRSAIEAAVHAQVDGWYDSPGPVLWARGST
jgi:long-subunit acyl-CoA synthetase (AMP-forming)